MATVSDYSDNEIFAYLDPSLVVSNPYCETEFNSFKIFQVLNDYVLALGCSKTNSSECYTYSDRIFFIPKSENDIYFDDKILKPLEGECPIYLGSYTYKSLNGISHTVPIVIFSKKELTKMDLAKLTESRNKIIKLDMKN
jgi:hypothetical protein